MTDYQRGRIAAQLAEPCPTDCSHDFWLGYLDEVHHPSGGLIPMTKEERKQELNLTSRVKYAIISTTKRKGK